MKIILPGSIRSKKNSKQIIPLRSKNNKPTWFQFYFRVKGGLRAWLYAQMTIQPSKAYAKWEKEARESLYRDGWRLKVLTCSVRVKAIYYYKGPRPDLSGCHESLGDAMEGIIWENDRQIERWHGDSCLIHDLKNPRTEVEVEEFHVKP